MWIENELQNDHKIHAYEVTSIILPIDSYVFLLNVQFQNHHKTHMHKKNHSSS